VATRLQTFLSYAFRPFFLLSGLFAVVVMGIWFIAVTGPTGVSAAMMLWHGHEMLVGFAMAAVAGFLLTAIATWTGRPPVAGGRLAILVAAWVLGRISMLYWLGLPAVVGAATDLVFPVLLCVFVAQEVIAGRSRRNYPIILITLLLLALDLTYHLGVTGVLPGADRFAVYMLLHLLLLLITIIGGRIVPSFTANWLRAKGSTRLPRSYALLEWTVPILTVMACFYSTFDPNSSVTGGIAAAAAVSHGLRLMFWRGLSTRSEPLLFVMHVAYAWLPIGYALTALASFGLGVTLVGALHALAMGGVAGMILAVTTRVALGHTGRPLHAARLTVIAYWLFNIAVVVRVLGYLSDRYMLTVELAAIGWIATFALFLWVYWPILSGPPEEQGSGSA
jgi:uncharacterized protein involved in response to NO